MGRRCNRVAKCEICGAEFSQKAGRHAQKVCSWACRKVRWDRTRLPIEDRFWSKVNKTDGCWVWTGATARGYGIILHDGHMWRAPRLSYLWAYGDLPDGLLVCHACDNPACVRPDHLFLGTQQDNVDDKMAKGRWRVPKE